jgi:para-nitrobenzyl esterase
MSRQSITWRRLCALFVLQLGVAGCTAQPISDQPTLQPSAAPPAAGPTVKVESGTVQGVLADGVIAFKGIPYAAPPVGDLRWAPPQPVAPWAGVRPATVFGPDCMQLANGDEPIRTTPSEDCLYVNVWQPADAEPGSQLPVMVWIHGGGYVGGGSSIPYYDGSAFARQGIVVVSLNYRLGRLGFFAHPALLAAAEEPSGNFGYMDQLAALRWVQTNIDAFGGDPQRVTVVGESAGGASVLHLLTMPARGGLFHQAVVMSGGGRRALAARPMREGTAASLSAEQLDAEFARSHGIEGEGTEALAALRALPAATLVGDLSLRKLLADALQGVPVHPGTPMVDGTIVTDEPGANIGRGAVADVPLLIGTTAVDLPLHFPPSRLDPLSYFGADAEAARAAYGAPAQFDGESLVRLLLSIAADMTMHEPARFVARAMSRNGNPVWLYRFTYTAESTRPESMGQTHAGELPFLFDTLAAKYGDGVTVRDQAVARAFNAYVANFVKDGDPNEDGLPPWPQFDPAAFELMDFTLDQGPVFGPEPRPGVALVERAAEANVAGE